MLRLVVLELREVISVSSLIRLSMQALAIALESREGALQEIYIVELAAVAK